MKYSPRLQQLMTALRCLPGVGPKSAQRMAFHLLEKDRDGARALAAALEDALTAIGLCAHCRMLAEQDVCPICADKTRDGSRLCIVETPADVIAVEDSAAYRGLYFVLMGRLSPLDGIGPEELGVGLFKDRLVGGDISEIILATSATVEGEATAAYLGRLAAEQDVVATRIAHGVPMGGELEYVDSSTLSLAISARTKLPAD